MKNKGLLLFRICAVAIATFGLTYRLLINPMDGNGFRYMFYQLGFFSIQTELMIFLVFVLLLISQLLGTRGPSPLIRGGILLYGLVTSILFLAFFIQEFHDINGLNRVVLYINHIGLTVLIMIDNIVSIKPDTYSWDYLIYWMIYPFYYLVFTIIENLVLEHYRYYFLIINRPNESFYPVALFLLALIFLFLGTMIIFINRIYRSGKIHDYIEKDILHHTKQNKIDTYEK